jgi:hypothetical protein
LKVLRKKPCTEVLLVIALANTGTMSLKPASKCLNVGRVVVLNTVRVLPIYTTFVKEIKKAVANVNPK